MYKTLSLMDQLSTKWCRISSINRISFWNGTFLSDEFVHFWQGYLSNHLRSTSECSVDIRSKLGTGFFAWTLCSRDKIPAFWQRRIRTRTLLAEAVIIRSFTWGPFLYDLHTFTQKNQPNVNIPYMDDMGMGLTVFFLVTPISGLYGFLLK